MSTELKRDIVYKKPVEVVDGARPLPLVEVRKIILIAAFVTLLLGSHAFQAWTNNLPIGSISDFLLYVAQAWQGWMDKTGITAFADTLRTLLHAFEGSR
jgi:hypothetical protein